MKKIKSLLWYALLLHPLFSISQQVSITPAHLPGDQTISNIVGLTQDINGFIWIADNNNGLFKYDGNHLTSYKPDANNLNSISASRLECVYADTKGNIWIGSFQNGLERFDPETETFTHFQHSNSDPSSIRSDEVRALLEDNDGILWVGTANGLDRLDIKTGKFTHIDNKSEDGLTLSREHVRTLYKDKAGTIWIGCGSPFTADDPNSSLGGLYKLDKATGKITRYQHNDKDAGSLIDNRVRAIYEDSRGVFWVGTSGDGLHIMDRKNGIFQRCLYDPHNPQKLSRPAIMNSYNYANDHITFINEDIQGCIWIGTFSGGINRYNPATNTMEHFGTAEMVPYKTVRNDYWACLKTKDNLLWASGWSPANNDQILYKISTTFNKPNYSNFGRVAIAFAQGVDSSMWFATNRGLLRNNKNNSYDSFFVDENKGGEKNVVINLEHDADDNLWVSTQSGLYHLNKFTKVFTGYNHDAKNKNSISSDTVIATQLNADGTIWIGTARGLDLMIIKTGIFKHYKHDPADSTTISNNFIQAIKKDKSGNIWIATNRGLNQFDKKTEKFSISVEKRAIAFCIFEDSQDRLWVGTLRYGLYVYNPQKNNFSRFNDSTGLIDNHLSVFGITEDKEHSLWLSTRFGFIQLNPKTKNAVLFGKSWNIDPNIGTNKGFTSSQGEIFFGDTAGYYHFLPQDFEKAKGILPQPFINKFFLSNKQLIPGTDKVLPEPLSQTEKITLRYNQNNFAIEFNSIDFITSESDKNLLYQLENYDDAWRKNSGESKAYYYNVPPGKYVFRVKAVNLYGKWGERSITINITPPWYKTWWAYLLFALVAIGILRAYIVYRSRKLQREKKILEEKVALRTKQLQQSLDDLKTTQSQLIQSEKMASLGELTAGIAHEIQNPLNFVNNFSEVSAELIDEMNEELATGNTKLAIEIANDLKRNLEKINHHGKRAGDIVKGMLQHSRSSSGVKEPTDINKLADEYLRLAYHGLRAKDKSFNATMKTDFDETIGNINIIPQDIGRVILNLINNAFYAAPLPPEGGFLDPDYKHQPTITVSTSKTPPSGGRGAEVVISVRDNGQGIPQKILDKIFQPFFTTKPTGQGTGLGLSLSYDIIKAHGGELKVETKEGEGSEFIIQIPVSKTSEA